MRLVLCCFLILSISFVFSDRILAAHTGGNIARSSQEPKYNIEFHAEDSPFQPNDEQESVIMHNKDGEKFLCYLPKEERSKSGKSFLQQNTSSLIVESDKHIKLKTPDELLEVLKDECFMKQEGWWSYEFCYHRKLQQFHFEDDKVVQEFTLGVYDDEATAAYNQNLSDISTRKDPRSKDAFQRYHVHLYTNGTICDLTNQPRETEVRFVCSETRTMINSITELSTCKYALTVQYPILCKHPSFQEERPVWHVINCNKLPTEHREQNIEEESFQDEKITMVADTEYPSSFDLEK